jgi:hypothetical protein
MRTKLSALYWSVISQAFWRNVAYAARSFSNERENARK